jgi:hypothetical protein
MMIMSRYDTDAIAEAVPGRIFAFDIRAEDGDGEESEGSQALVVSHDGEHVLAMGENWWVSRLEIRDDEDGGVVATVTYQENFGHPFHAGEEYRDLKETMPEEKTDPPPPKGTVERRRYDQQMREAYHELMKPIQELQDHSES